MPAIDVPLPYDVLQRLAAPAQSRPGATAAPGVGTIPATASSGCRHCGQEVWRADGARYCLGLIEHADCCWLDHRDAEQLEQQALELDDDAD